MAEAFNLYPLIIHIPWISYLVILYATCFLLLFTLLLLFCLQQFRYSSSGNHAWLWKICAIWIHLLITIFYFPVIGLLISIFDCQNIDGELKHSIYQSIICFDGNYWIHALISLIFLIIFVPAITFLTFLLYESRNKSQNDATARFQSYPETFEIGYKTLLCILVLVFRGNEGQWIMAISMLSITGLLFAESAFKFRFINSKAGMLRRCFLTLNCWSFFVMLFQLILNTSAKISGTELFIIGLPLLLFVVVLKRDQFWTALPLSYKQGGNPESIYNKANTFTCMALTKSNFPLYYIRKKPRKSIYYRRLFFFSPCKMLS